MEKIIYINPEALRMKRPRAFDIDFERERAVKAESDFLEKQSFLSYELMQMETHLGERFNVGISRYNFEIRDGKLYGEGMDEPFKDSIRRGIERRRVSGNPTDRAREEAELVGFEKIENLFLDDNTPVGTMMLSISPSGGEESTYQHNFYDIFTLKEKNDKRYIETRRYASGLSIDDYKKKLAAFIDINVDEKDPAAYFLAKPIAIRNTLTPDDLHQYLHKDRKFLDEMTFEIIKKHCRGIAQVFAESLIEAPDNFHLHKRLFNAYLNKADEVFERMLKEGVGVWQKITPINDSLMIQQDVLIYGQREVKEVMTGCGFSGGYETSGKITKSPFGVSEFGKNWDYHKGDCVNCKRRYIQVGPCSICKDCEKKFDEEE